MLLFNLDRIYIKMSGNKNEENEKVRNEII
jgi:hypothetical protein